MALWIEDMIRNGTFGDKSGSINDQINGEKNFGQERPVVILIAPEYPGGEGKLMELRKSVVTKFWN
jgi:hypothetical protein